VPVVITRPVIITILAVLHFLGAAFWLLVGLGSLGATTVQGGPDAAAALFTTPIFVGIGLAQLFCGIGLLKLKPYGRTLQLVFAWIGLIGVPIGTILSVLILIYLFKPGIKLIFAGRPGDDFTPEEAAQIKEDTSTSGAMVAIVVVVGVLLLVMIAAIIAAISVPAMLRARTSGNEATAVASLRAIASAEITYATTCAQGYAVTLEDLAKPPNDGSRPFLTSDLGRSGVQKSGYIFTVTRDRSPLTVDTGTPAATCNGATSQPASSFFAWAEPVNSGSGSRYFATDARGTIWESLQPISNPIVSSSTVTPVR
jgi:type II secretory pathway pseudopilin PulG